MKSLLLLFLIAAFQVQAQTNRPAIISTNTPAGRYILLRERVKTITAQVFKDEHRADNLTRYVTDSKNRRIAVPLQEQELKTLRERINKAKKDRSDLLYAIQKLEVEHPELRSLPAKMAERAKVKAK